MTFFWLCKKNLTFCRLHRWNSNYVSLLCTTSKFLCTVALKKKESEVVKGNTRSVQRHLKRNKNVTLIETENKIIVVVFYNSVLTQSWGICTRNLEKLVELLFSNQKYSWGQVCPRKRQFSNKWLGPAPLERDISRNTQFEAVPSYDMFVLPIQSSKGAQEHAVRKKF